MEFNNRIIDEIMQDVEAPEIIQTLNNAWQKEQEKRNQFYENVTDSEKAEFISGEIIVHSPVKIEHNAVNFNIGRIIETYVVENDLGFVGIEKIMIRLTRNDFEPDLCFFKKEIADTFKEGMMFFPTPTFIVEVLSESTAKNDRTIKFKDYEKHKVQEYWIVDAQNKTIEQYLLKKNKFELSLKSNSGKISVKSLNNLTFEIATIFDKKLTNQFIKTL